MTRTHKSNDIPHNHPEATDAFHEHQIPKFFGKSGHVDQAPNKVKKNGGGRGNWGPQGYEAEDLIDFATFKQRRRSNSISHIDTLPSKFDVNEEEPDLEEELTSASTPASTSASAATEKN